jgi:hypothetical protein
LPGKSNPLWLRIDRLYEELAVYEGSLWIAAISGNGRRPNLIPGWAGRLASWIGDRRIDVA